MLRLSALLACGILSTHAEAAEPIPGPVPAEIIEIIDGDTIAVRARIWPGQFVETRVRLRGVDTPETRRPGCEAERAAGGRASLFTQAWLSTDPPGDAEGAESAAAGFTLHDVDLGSFAGRVIARIERVDGADLSTALMEAGLAAEYGEDGPWCDDQGADPAD